MDMNYFPTLILDQNTLGAKQLSVRNTGYKRVYANFSNFSLVKNTVLTSERRENHVNGLLYWYELLRESDSSLKRLG